MKSKNIAIISFISGVLFALGLGIAGMTQPQKIIAFLDVFGAWDPSLVFVMLSGIGIHFIAYRLIRKRQSPIFSTEWHVPTKTEITPALIVGAIIFGIGWGLGGFCPGPALVALASFKAKPFVFVFSMLLGMFLFHLVDSKLKIRK